MLEPADFHVRVEARLLDMMDCKEERKAEILAAEAGGYVSAAREFGVISHEVFKKVSMDIEERFLEWLRSAERSKRLITV